MVLILGGDHGVGAFHMPFSTVIVLKDGTIHKQDIGIATVTGSKDSAHVIARMALKENPRYCWVQWKRWLIVKYLC
jgi:hypothetical protein